MKALIVVDYQNDFLDGSLAFPEAKSIESKIAEKISKAESEGSEIIFLKDCHSEHYLDTQEGRKLPIVHCTTERGRDIYGSIKEMSIGHKIIEKDSFGSKELLLYLEEKGYSELEFCGIMSDICVITNVIVAKTALPEAEISVDSCAIATNSAKKHEAAIEVMKSIQIDVYASE